MNLKNRILAISDIHGMYDQLCDMLSVTQYDPKKDQLILLGDYMDRGMKSRQTLELIIDLVKDGAVAICGNHDHMFLDFIDCIDFQTFLHNGGAETLRSYVPEEDWDMYWGDLHYVRKLIMDQYPHHIEFLRKLPYYYETEKHIFVHGGINPFLDDWKNTVNSQFIWIRDMFIDNEHQAGKTVVFGHTPCVNLHGIEDVWFGGDKIGIDGACAYGMQLNCLEIVNGESEYNTYVVEVRPQRTMSQVGFTTK